MTDDWYLVVIIGVYIKEKLLDKGFVDVDIFVYKDLKKKLNIGLIDVTLHVESRIQNGIRKHSFSFVPKLD